jgi:DNA polymerase III subunit beta
MKLRLKTASLQRGVSLVGKTVPTNSPLPVLMNILLRYRAGEKTIRLLATNFETGVSCDAELEEPVDKDLEIAIPGKIFTELVASLPSEITELDYTEKNRSLALSSDSVKANIKCNSPEDFPSFPVFGSSEIEISAEVFKRAALHVGIAAAPTHSNAVLTGVFMGREKNRLVLAATDGVRFSVQRIEAQLDKTRENLHVIIPAKSLSEVVRVSQETAVEIFFTDDDKVVFRCNDVEIFCLRIAGQYIDYKMLEAAKNAEPVCSLTLRTSELLRACKQVNIFSEEGKSSVTFDVNSLFVQLRAQSKESGDGVVNMTGGITGQSVAVTLAYSLLSELLNVIETPQVKLDLLGPRSPAVFYTEPKSDFFHVIMPISR